MSDPADPKGFYAVLGVSPSATPEEIKDAFRLAAKRFHPDHAVDDAGERFRELTEAYDTLRDGRRRMQYDATRLADAGLQPESAGRRPDQENFATFMRKWQKSGASARSQPTADFYASSEGLGRGRASAMPEIEPEPEVGRGIRPRKRTRTPPTGSPWQDRSGLQLRHRPSGLNRLLGGSAALLACTLIVSLVLLWSAQERLNERELQLQSLSGQLDQAVRDQADIRARYWAARYADLETLAGASPERGMAINPAAGPDETMAMHSGVEPSVGRVAERFLYQAEIDFPADGFDLDRTRERQIERSILEVAQVISGIPEGQDWLILVDGHSGQAARGGGVAVDAWELALLRLGAVIDFMAGQGLPSSRLAVRFRAGFHRSGEPRSDGGTVEIKLLCCLNN